MDSNYKELDGGVNDLVSETTDIQTITYDIIEDLTLDTYSIATRRQIQLDSEIVPVDYDDLMDKMDQTNAIEINDSGDMGDDW